MLDTTTGPALVDYLLARWAEDVRAATAVLAWEEAPREPRLPWETIPADQRVIAWGLTCVAAASVPTVAQHIARQHPGRVLARVAVYRELVKAHPPVDDPYSLTGRVCATCNDGSLSLESGGRLSTAPATWPCRTLRLLVLPYADRADFHPDWRLP